MTIFDNAVVLLFVKDYTGDSETKFFLLKDGIFAQASTSEVGNIDTTVICHDFWLIKDELEVFDSIPTKLFDISEIQVAISQKLDIRIERDKKSLKLVVPTELLAETESNKYNDIFLKKAPIDLEFLASISETLLLYAKALLTEADGKGELSRLIESEIPLYGLLMQHSAKRIYIDTDKVKEFRSSIEHEFYLALKEFSMEFDVQPETLNDKHLKDYLEEKGFNLDGISLDYILEYIPMEGDFGPALKNLRELKATKGILNDLSLSTGTISPIVDSFGTRTSRIIYRNPALQNLPKRYRELIIPRPGFKLCYVDYDQFEVGIMAAISGDETLKSLFAGDDMYEEFAAQHLKKTGFRKNAKRLFLSYAYGMTKKSVIDAAVELGANRAIAKTAFSNFNRYEDWKKEKEREFDKNGHMSTLLGNYILGNGKPPFSRRNKRQMISQCIQGTGSLIFKNALIEVAKLSDVRIVLPMHDAILFEHMNDETPALVIDKMQNVMTAILSNKVKGKASINSFYE